MRVLVSIAWLTALSVSTFVSGLLPVHTPPSAEHLATSSPATARSAARQGDQSIYPGYGPGYGPYPSCKISPNQLPPGWPSSAAPPFTSTFTQFLNNAVHVPPNSPPVPITVSQVSPPLVDTPRTITGLPYQLLYNNQYPGPTIRVTSQQTDNSTLTIGTDTTPAGPPLTQVSVSNGVIGQPTSMPVPFPYFTTHLHGGHTAPEHDGHPNDLLPPMPPRGNGVGTDVSPPLVPPAHVYSYTNDQQPQILWYHDHADMNTTQHVAQGLFAFYIIEEAPDDLSYPYLPKGPYDIPLGLQVQQAGTQSPGIPVDPPDQTIPNYFVAVNGVDSPKLDVEGRFYRFRVLNASVDQVISLELCDGNGNNLNRLVWLIGTDGGMLPRPLNLPDRTIDSFHDGRLDVFQAERYDLLIDFTGLAGQTLYLSGMVRQSNACMGTVKTAPNAIPTCIDQEYPILAFNVTPPTGPDNTELSQIGNRSWQADTAFLQQNHSSGGSFNPTPDRVFSFDVGGNQLVISGQPYNQFRLTNSGIVDANGNTMPYPRVIKPALVNANSVEVWELTNTVTCAIHPVHVHDIEFQNVMVNGQQLTPAQIAQFGWKDVFVLMPPYSATDCPWAPLNNAPSISFIGYYESHWTQATAPPPTQIGDTVPWLQTPDGTSYTALTSGTYVFHCHNLFHEDDVMMGQFQVLPPSFIPPTGASAPATDAGRNLPGRMGTHGN